MKSSAVLIANKKALEDPEKREKIYDIVALLKGVVDGSKTNPHIRERQKRKPAETPHRTARTEEPNHCAACR